ncbi:hypothetical protein EV356DRAFT_499876 [Viridothelium virens]|uniref:Uncharacterized protein n=1 Tax=Viridothelium virens TaxID=1048519 RepID=A0A6A6HNK7_VIRVR|nr:hypothetical protein EV356DRAFT_499876 [Viridothelium virens]
MRALIRGRAYTTAVDALNEHVSNSCDHFSAGRVETRMTGSRAWNVRHSAACIVSILPKVMADVDSACWLTWRIEEGRAAPSVPRKAGDHLHVFNPPSADYSFMRLSSRILRLEGNGQQALGQHWSSSQKPSLQSKAESAAQLPQCPSFYPTCSVWSSLNVLLARSQFLLRLLFHLNAMHSEVGGSPRLLT